MVRCVCAWHSCVGGKVGYNPPLLYCKILLVSPILGGSQSRFNVSSPLGEPLWAESKEPHGKTFFPTTYLNPTNTTICSLKYAANRHCTATGVGREHKSHLNSANSLICWDALRDNSSTYMTAQFGHIAVDWSLVLWKTITGAPERLQMDLSWVFR